MKDLIQLRLDTYQSQTIAAEENALKEITQEIALYALAESGFFQKASFQGGTCLRIIHGLDRYSEDLDFSLNAPDPSFNIGAYLEPATKLMNTYGYAIEITGKDSAKSNVQMRFLKDDSIKLLLGLNHLSDVKKKIKIKIEIDTNPPAAAAIAPAFVDFPMDFSVNAHDLSTLFAGKCHALLCRDYTKGRDWYDLSWYGAQKATVNYSYISNALKQVGPWANQEIQVNAEWLQKQLSDRIEQVDWSAAVADVQRFVPAEKSSVLKLWSAEFFSSRVKKMFGS
jgi:predicted nucleotidyltransferase component of viral defense system